jgi:hypothetical protein
VLHRVVWYCSTMFCDATWQHSCSMIYALFPFRHQVRQLIGRRGAADLQLERVEKSKDLMLFLILVLMLVLLTKHTACGRHRSSYDRHAACSMQPATCNVRLEPFQCSNPMFEPFQCLDRAREPADRRQRGMGMPGDRLDGTMESPARCAAAAARSDCRRGHSAVLDYND